MPPSQQSSLTQISQSSRPSQTSQTIPRSHRTPLHAPLHILQPTQHPKIPLLTSPSDLAWERAFLSRQRNIYTSSLRLQTALDVEGGDDFRDAQIWAARKVGTWRCLQRRAGGFAWRERAGGIASLGVLSQDVGSAMRSWRGDGVETSGRLVAKGSDGRDTRAGSEIQLVHGAGMGEQASCSAAIGEGQPEKRWQQMKDKNETGAMGPPDLPASAMKKRKRDPESETSQARKAARIQHAAQSVAHAPSPHLKTGVTKSTPTLKAMNPNTSTTPPTLKKRKRDADSETGPERRIKATKLNHTPSPQPPLSNKPSTYAPPLLPALLATTPTPAREKEKEENPNATLQHLLRHGLASGMGLHLPPTAPRMPSTYPPPPPRRFVRSRERERERDLRPRAMGRVRVQSAYSPLEMAGEQMLGFRGEGSEGRRREDGGENGRGTVRKEVLRIPELYIPPAVLGKKKRARGMGLEAAFGGED